MRLRYLLIMGGLISWSAMGVQYPHMTSVRVTSCGNSTCEYRVTFESGGTLKTNIEPRTVRPNPYMGTELIPVGTNCQYGDRSAGIPYKNCQWDSRYAPPMTGRCHLRNSGTWEVNETDTCSTAMSWTLQNVKPEGLCIVFAQRHPTDPQTYKLWTPWGELSAEVAANSGGEYCIKPLPPTVQCKMNLPPSVDHGVVAPGTSSEVAAYGDIDCGGSPKLDVMGAGIVQRDGVEYTVVPTLESINRVRIATSVKVGQNTSGGGYETSFVIVAAPY